MVGEEGRREGGRVEGEEGENECRGRTRCKNASRLMF